MTESTTEARLLAQGLSSLRLQIDELPAREQMADWVATFNSDIDRVDRAPIASALHPDAGVDRGGLWGGSGEGLLETTVEFQALHRDTQQAGEAR
jgi:hypothetical protein